MQFPPEDFDQWAAGYDAETSRGLGYPFEGYQRLLQCIIKHCDPHPGQRVLDLGCGTGNLSACFFDLDCQVLGIDFSEEMIAIARQKYPAIQFQVQDIRAPLGGHIHPSYDHIVSAYVFHHFPLDEKIRLIQRFVAQHSNPGGKLIIGDLIFADQAARHQTALDYPADWEEEYFWMEEEDLPRLQVAGLQVELERVSFCAGVLSITQIENGYNENPQNHG